MRTALSKSRYFGSPDVSTRRKETSFHTLAFGKDAILNYRVTRLVSVGFP